MSKTSKWKPDIKFTAILRTYFDMGLASYTASRQRVPENNYGIVKMPDPKTIDKYWRFWKAEHVKEHMDDLSEMQKNVKAQFAIAYDKQIMISESQIQEILKYKQEHEVVYQKEQKALVDDKKQSFIEPMEPNVQVELLLAKINELQGDQKMAKAALLVAPIVNQMSEESIIKELEQEQENIIMKSQEIKRGKKHSSKRH